jgi:hypothetical protein
MDQYLDQEKDLKKKGKSKKRFYRLHMTGMVIILHTAPAGAVKEIFFSKGKLYKEFSCAIVSR